MCSIELIEYGSRLCSSSSFFKSSAVFVFKNSRSFAAQISFWAGSVLPARMSLTRNAVCAEIARSPLGFSAFQTRRPSGPRTVRRENAAGLTRRQNEVLVLLGDGLGNADIAERLGLSAKTVEHHVSQVLGKLGLRSRAEAAAYATQHLPLEPYSKEQNT